MRVHVNSIAPGYFQSEMMAKQCGPDMKSELSDEKVQKKGHVSAMRAGSDEEMGTNCGKCVLYEAKTKKLIMAV